MSTLSFLCLPTLQSVLWSTLTLSATQEKIRKLVELQQPAHHSPVEELDVDDAISVSDAKEDEEIWKQSEEGIRSAPARTTPDLNRSTRTTAEGSEGDRASRRGSTQCDEEADDDSSGGALRLLTPFARFRWAMLKNVLDDVFHVSSDAGRQQLLQWCDIQQVVPNVSCTADLSKTQDERFAVERGEAERKTSGGNVPQRLRSACKSLVILLCDAHLPDYMVEGAECVLQDISQGILLCTDPLTSAQDKAEGACVAALAAFVKGFLLPHEETLLLAALPSAEAKPQLVASMQADPDLAPHVFYLAIVQAFRSASQCALRVLDDFGCHFDYVLSSVKNACDPKSSTKSLTAARTRCQQVASLSRILLMAQALQNRITSDVAPAIERIVSRVVGVRSTVVERPDRTDTEIDACDASVLSLFDTLGGLPASVLSDSHLSVPRTATSPQDVDMCVPTEYYLAIHPLHHCRSTARSSPFTERSARGVSITSIGSKCLLLGPEANLATLQRGDIAGATLTSVMARKSTTPPSTSFTTVFGAARCTSFTQVCRVPWAGGEVLPCDDEAIVAAACTLLDGTSGVQLYDITRARRVEASSLQDCPWFGERRLAPDVIPSSSDAHHRLEYVTSVGGHGAASDPALLPRAAVVDPSGLSIKSVASVGHGILAVGPALRLVRCHDLLDDSIAPPQEQNTEGDEKSGERAAVTRRSDTNRVNPFLQVVPSKRLSFPADDDVGPTTLMTSVLCGFGNGTDLLAADGNIVALWDMETSTEKTFVPMDVSMSAGSHYVTSVDACAREHVVVVGTSAGVVGLWDVRASRKLCRLFRANASVCGSYSGTCAVQRVRFGATGARSVFLTTPSIASASQVQLFHIGFEKRAVWKTPDDVEVAAFDVGVCGPSRRTFLHVVDTDGSVMGGDVSYLVA